MMKIVTKLFWAGIARIKNGRSCQKWQMTRMNDQSEFLPGGLPVLVIKVDLAIIKVNQTIIFAAKEVSKFWC